jgi:hypothetical protein
MKVKEAIFSETLYETTHSHIPKDCYLNVLLRPEIITYRSLTELEKLTQLKQNSEA